jgi:hypothetical protein
MPAATPDLEGIAVHLATAGVEFIVVGGLAAVAHGVPVGTLDIDIVHDRSERNVSLLASALVAIDAHYRGRPEGQILRPQTATLAGPGHHQLLTDLGPIDVLGTVTGGKAYADLFPESEVLVLRGRPIRFLKLEAVAELKAATGRDKDKAALPVIRATIAAKKKPS